MIINLRKSYCQTWFGQEDLLQSRQEENTKRNFCKTWNRLRINILYIFEYYLFSKIAKFIKDLINQTILVILSNCNVSLLFQSPWSIESMILEGWNKIKI